MPGTGSALLSCVEGAGGRHSAGNSGDDSAGVGTTPGWRPKRSGRRCAAVALIIPFLVAGCEKPIDLPPMEVRTVEAYGQTLDASATPQQVVYVLLRSLREDFEAAQARDRARQKEAFRLTFSLAAYRGIEKQLVATGDLEAPSPSPPSGWSHERKARIHTIVYHWAPVVSHYVRSFDEDPATMMSGMEVAMSADGEQADVGLEVVHDPAEQDPARQQRARLEVRLVREPDETGATRYWRVVRVGFSASKAAPTAGVGQAAATKPVSPSSQ